MTHDVQPLKWSKKTNFEEHMQFFDKINEIVNNLGPTVDAAETAIASIEEVKTNAESAVATANQASAEARAAAAQAQGAAQSVADVDSRIAGKADASNVYTKTETDGKLSGKLDKTGGTLTGALTSNANIYLNSAGEHGIVVNRTDATRDGGWKRLRWDRAFLADGSHASQILSTISSNTVENSLVVLNSNQTSYKLGVHCSESDGYATAPTPSASNDNSTKIATTAWVNSASSVVHKTGNETIGGAKTFTSRMSMSGGRMISINHNLPSKSAPTSTQYESGMIMCDTAGLEVGALFHQVNANATDGITILSSVSNGTARKEARLILWSKEDGTAYATVPATPSTATGNEIATAGWVRTLVRPREPIVKNYKTGLPALSIDAVKNMLNDAELKSYDEANIYFTCDSVETNKVHHIRFSGAKVKKGNNGALYFLGTGIFTGNTEYEGGCVYELRISLDGNDVVGNATLVKGAAIEPSVNLHNFRSVVACEAIIY